MAAIAPGARTESTAEPTLMQDAPAPVSGERAAATAPTLIDLLRDGAKRYGDRPALLIRPGFRTRIWSYRDLGDLAPRVARVLTDMGLERGDRVLIWGVNRPEWSIGFFGALFAGIVLVPLDVRSQPEFVEKIAQRTRAKLVLASTQTAPAAQALNLPVVLIESLPDRARGVDPLPTPQISASDLVEVVFTSGTTGEPKGAMLTHGNLMANATALRAVFPFKPDERLLSILPLSHMFEQTCGLTAPFLAGASIVYPVSRQPAVLMRTFRDFRVTMLLIVPAGLKLLDSAIQRKVDAGGKRASFEKLHRIARHLPRALKRLLFRPVISGFGGRFRTVAVGAAALEEDLANRWTNMGFDVLQGYGATELSPAVSFTRPSRNRIGTVGEAVPGVEIRIAEDGEVLVRGESVFAGYWEDTDATAAAIDAEGFYHSGDIGQLDEGFLTLRGRKKDMLAMPDGTKVYPEDIEAVLARDERLRDAVVVGYTPPRGEMRVHAVLLTDDPDWADAVVRDANSLLGAHQQIRGVTIWPDEDFPRTPTLKVKKRLVIERLVELEDGASPAQAAEPVTAAPQAGASGVATLVASVANLPISSVQPGSSLSSDLNMDSLARVELLGVIEEEMGIYIDDADLDPETTVEQLTALVEAARDVKPETGIFGWPLSPVARVAGIAIQTLFMVPAYFVMYRVRVTGLGRLRGLRGPALFTPNHHLHNDVGLILTRFPIALRWRLSTAAAADDIFGNRIRGLGAALIGNAFPLAREGAIRRSLELLGARLDRGFSILIFPEGKLTVGGPMQPFKSGTGLIAVEGATPVVPMRLTVHRYSRLDSGAPPDAPRSWRGEVELIFGDPIHFAWDADHAAATARLEAAVTAL